MRSKRQPIHGYKDVAVKVVHFKSEDEMVINEDMPMLMDLNIYHFWA